MVRAWFMDTDEGDQRLEHQRNPPAPIAIDDLFAKTGVEYFQLNVDTFSTDGKLDAIRKERGYSYEDEVTCSKECLPDYDNKLKSFFREHLHSEEEIRFILDGSGYFDVRDGDDNWIRIEVVGGDLIVIPRGIYHRFTLDVNNYIKTKRYFIGEPVWHPYNRPADDMPVRHEYLTQLQQGFQIPQKS